MNKILRPRGSYYYIVENNEGTTIYLSNKDGEIFSSSEKDGAGPVFEKMKKDFTVEMCSESEEREILKLIEEFENG